MAYSQNLVYRTYMLTATAVVCSLIHIHDCNSIAQCLRKKNGNYLGKVRTNLKKTEATVFTNDQVRFVKKGIIARSPWTFLDVISAHGDRSMCNPRVHTPRLGSHVGENNCVL